MYICTVQLIYKIMYFWITTPQFHNHYLAKCPKVKAAKCAWRSNPACTVMSVSVARRTRRYYLLNTFRMRISAARRACHCHPCIIMHGPIFLSCSGEGGAGVHPGPVPGRLVAGGGVAAHVGCTGGGPHRRPPAPRHTPARGRPQVGFYRVAVLLLTVNFTAKARGKSWQCQGNTCNTFCLVNLSFFPKDSL